MTRQGLWACVAVGLAGLNGAACGSGEAGQSTQTACPDASTLTYEADIAPIMAKYCVSCHASTVPGAQRHGAPTDHNFDTELGILEEAEHVDSNAGSSGTVTNTEMPPRGYPAPTVEERMKLSQWLACEVPAERGHAHD
ncbi:MAG: uncharacterized protein JWN48_4418 [Myxococcaceae bacterium]|nr:uncharacterized protein [Myxococcaceae bacterium]